MYSNVFSYVIDSTITPGTIEYSDEGRQLIFYSKDELAAWLGGDPFRLIVRWTVPAKPPRAWK